jgi:serine/threonine protein kinase
MNVHAARANVSVEALVGQVADEFTQRLNRGERPSVEEYVEQHPEIAELLREVLPALGLLRRPDVEAALADGDPNLAEPLGDFRLVREIGRGGMGVVYEAIQLSLKRTVAVKVLPFAAALDPRQLQRFKNEAQAAASLHHEHIVPVYFVGCERRVHFYAMQYIEGLSLAAVIAELRRVPGQGPADPQHTGPYFSAPDALTTVGPDTAPLAALTSEGSQRLPGFFHTVARLGLEAAKGLDHAHREFVLHRDVKPANLLVDVRGNLWITDFGLAQMRSDTQLTLTGELVGTIRYMSPEQALAKRVPVDQRTDVYSLGATLYELLTLEPIFGGTDRQELLRQISFDDPRSPRSLNRHVPRDLETIVLTALAKSPAHRYASAKELAEDLHRFLNDQPIKARPEGLLRWLRRRSRRAASGLLLGLSGVITSVVLLVLFLSLNGPSPKEKEHRLQQEALTVLTRELDRDRKVTLIEERGQPGYFRWRSDESPGKILSTQDGTFSVQNWESGLVELLPDPRLQCYRFRAEVRHERQANQESKVGIYFAHSEHPAGDAVAHFHMNVAFNDLVYVGEPPPNGRHPGNVVGLELHRQAPAGLAYIDKFVHPKAMAFFKPARPVGAFGPWRTIAVEVRPKTIKLFWEGKQFASTTWDELFLTAGKTFLLSPPGRPRLASKPQFAPRDGLGLFVSLGVASFRNVTVEPIGNEN